MNAANCIASLLENYPETESVRITVGNTVFGRSPIIIYEFWKEGELREVNFGVAREPTDDRHSYMFTGAFQGYEHVVIDGCSVSPIMITG
jgi:hypothetical protein